jgi:hypothetical protein
MEEYMTKLVCKKPIKLKNNKDITEKMIQDLLCEDPNILGIDDNLILLKREKVQSSGGILDILFGNMDDEIRYCVEVQLGPTNESHIIRTIEYWDIEQKRYPNIRHIPVLVAENVTGRFYNVINLFNKAIPMIAIQMSAFQESDGTVSLTFSKVLDLSASYDEDDDDEVITDRAYWENRAPKARLDLMDFIFKDCMRIDESSV